MPAITATGNGNVSSRTRSALPRSAKRSISPCTTGWTRSCSQRSSAFFENAVWMSPR